MKILDLTFGWLSEVAKGLSISSLLVRLMNGARARSAKIG